MIMAASFFSPSFPFDYPPFSIYPAITVDEILSFHNIDRMLYTRLVMNLNREPTQSMQVMAFWLWIEMASHDRRLIFTVLRFPDPVINVLADETVLCLAFMQKDGFPASMETGDISFLQSFLQSLTSKGEVTLRFFHANREMIIRNITKIMNNVCLRVFTDITERAMQIKARSHNPESNNAGASRMFANSRSQLGHNPPVSIVPAYVGTDCYANNPENILARLRMQGHNSQSTNPPANFPVPYSYHSVSSVWPHIGGGADRPWGRQLPSISRPLTPATNRGGYLDLLVGESDDIEQQRQVLDMEMSEVLSNLHLEDSSGDEVPHEERTIFLTFSKGYPISETEVQEYFTRKYGDFIEEIRMQEVTSTDEQPLYARLVVRSVATIDIILNGKSKAKFAINGKHVWARRYVRKNPNRPSSPNTDPVSPPSVQP